MLKDDESPLAVGKRLKVLRAMAGLNRHVLAEQAEVSKTSISYWEHGKGSPMTARSMRKIISTMEKSGIICSEEWLKTGNGTQPSAINTVKKSSLSPEVQKNLDIFDSAFFEEINLFLSTCTHPKNAVIIKIEHEAMSPFFQKGDIIGGIFVPLHSVDLSKEKICIIKTNGKLDIRRIRTNLNSSTSLFNLSYLSFDSKCAQAFEINNFPLKTLAPILRLWR